MRGLGAGPEVEVFYCEEAGVRPRSKVFARRLEAGVRPQSRSYYCEKLYFEARPGITLRAGPEVEVFTARRLGAGGWGQAPK